MEDKRNIMLDSFGKLRQYCEKEQFRGWDPYDGLNSKIFQSLPGLKHSPWCRLAVIQGFKRCPINLRRIALVPKEYNAKGIGLFLQGYCNLYRVAENRGVENDAIQKCIGTKETIQNCIHDLSQLLLSLQSKGDYHGACWGYNFDWQAYGGLYFPRYTPTVVATNFCATALMEAYEITKNQEYLDVALSSAAFVLEDLHRCPTALNGDTNNPDSEFLFSYSKLPGNDTVYNASLLGSRLLSYCYKYTKNETYKTLAEASVKACCHGQREDGAWVYGMRPTQNWVDSFHTGYNLDGLIAYEENIGDTKYHEYIEKGFAYYMNHFFEADGTPKYYDNQMYPIDIHCPGQLLVTLSRLHQFESYRETAEKVLQWSIDNMQDPKGYFYYQIKKGMSSKISYMRWSNAFMFNAMSYYLLGNYGR